MKKPIVHMVEPRRHRSLGIRSNPPQPQRHRTIEDFLNIIGISPLSTALRAIDKYNLEHVFLVLEDEVTLYSTSEGLDLFPLDTPVKFVGAGCIAWDGSDWEFSDVAEFTGAGSVEQVRRNCHLAYNEHQAEE